MRVLVTPSFVRATKKLHLPQKTELDQAVRAISNDPAIGDAKVGDVVGIQVGISQDVVALGDGELSPGRSVGIVPAKR